MRKGIYISSAAVIIFISVILVKNFNNYGKDVITVSMQLPEPAFTGKVSVEETLHKRRSIRDFSNEPLDIGAVSQLLWSGQGITDKRGFRTAPSAGALYPIEIYLVVGKVDGLVPGVYKYKPGKNEAEKIVDGDKRNDLYASALYQRPIDSAPMVIVITAVYDRVTVKYRERGVRYAHMETGHVAQNICLQAVALNLGTVVIGAFNDNDVKRAIQLEEGEEPLYIIPVGKLDR